MATINIVSYSVDQSPFVIAEFEEVMRSSMLRYSMKHLLLAGVTSEENFNQMLTRSIQVCQYAGIRVDDHFRQIFVFAPATGTTYTDWLMSKKGFKLMLMQNPDLNENMAHYLWEIADH
jgi:hypothetical protein